MLRILVTNDDGIHAIGIKKLVESLRMWASVYVSAPSDERSAVGHGITVREPLKAELIDFYMYQDVVAWSINGNPADCVKMALVALMDEAPDLIISGINAGVNLGKDVYYSGTVAAAREGVIFGIPSIAISYNNHFHPKDFGSVENILKPLLQQIRPNLIPKDVLLNINIPHSSKEQIKGIASVPLDLHHYSDHFQRKEMPANQFEYWLERKYDREHVELNDYSMLKKGYITATPIHIDSTDKQLLNQMKKWSWGL